MGQLRILGVAGDSKTTWEPTDVEQVAVAERKTEDLLYRGYALFVADPQAPGFDRRIDRFEPLAPRIIAVPPMVGGADEPQFKRNLTPEERQDYSRRYHDATHGMQSGVALEMQYARASTEPKHLRVGVNSALVDGAGLARLLIAKGLITEDEYLQAITQQMEIEKAGYEQRLSALTGAPITLG